MNKLLKLNKQEQGYSLAGVLIIFIVATVLGMSIVALSVNSMNISNKEHDDQSAYYIAESGTTYQLAKIETLVSDAADDTEKYIDDVKDGTISDATFDPEDHDDVKDKFFEIFDEKLHSSGLNHTPSYTGFELIKGVQPEAEITVELDASVTPADNPKLYNITSTGTIGEESREVELPININWYNEPEYALLTEKIIDVGHGGATEDYIIDGDIGILNDEIPSISFDYGGKPPLSGDIFVPGGNPDIVNPKPQPEEDYLIEALDEDTSLPMLPDFDEMTLSIIDKPTYIPADAYKDGTTQVIDNGHLSITHSNSSDFELKLDDPDKYMYLNSLKISANTNLKIVTSLPETTLVIKDLHLGEGKIIIEGTGVVNIYVEDEFLLPTAGEMKFGQIDEVEQLNIFYAGDNNLSFVGDHKIFGSIFAKKSNFSFGAGGGFYGNILTGGTEITFKDGMVGSSQLILAPNATVNHEAGVIKGVIVSKEYKVTNGNLIYQEVDMEGPLSLDEIMNNSVNDGNTFMKRSDPSIEKQSVREK